MRNYNILLILTQIYQIIHKKLVITIDYPDYFINTKYSSFVSIGRLIYINQVSQNIDPKIIIENSNKS